jgi:ABC-type spermidine/putrescine transport system permease subunit I
MPVNAQESRQLLPALPLTALFLGAFVLPLIALIFISLFTTPQFTAMSPIQYVRFFTDPFSLNVLSDTLLLGAIVAMLALVLAYPLGSRLRRKRISWTRHHHVPDPVAAADEHGRANFCVARHPRTRTAL